MGIKGEKLMVWPPSSPDLNPIENLWSILKRNIYEGARQLASKQLLWEAILTSCKEIQAETLQKFSSSMDVRIVKVISKTVISYCECARGCDVSACAAGNKRIGTESARRETDRSGRSCEKSSDYDHWPVNRCISNMYVYMCVCVYHICTDVSANNRYRLIKAIYFTISRWSGLIISCQSKGGGKKRVRLQLLLLVKKISVEFRAVKINVTKVLTLWLCSDSCHTCGVPGQKWPDSDQLLINLSLCYIITKYWI